MRINLQAVVWCVVLCIGAVAEASAQACVDSSEAVQNTWRDNLFDGSPAPNCEGALSEVQSCVLAALEAANPAYDYGIVSGSWCDRNGADGTCDLYYTKIQTYSGGSPYYSPNNYQQNRVSIVPYCPDDPDIQCDALGNVNTLGAATGQPDSFTPGDTICVKSAKVGGVSKTLGGPGNQNGCAAFKRSTQTYKRLGPTDNREWLVQYQFTGLECDGEDEQTQTPDPKNDGESCKTGPGGLTWCENPQDPTGKDCGFFNDKYVCLDALGSEKCFTEADGSRICVEGAPSPPVPDNGTPGAKAPPDDVMQVCTGASSCQQINYYNSTTNAGSSRPTGTGGAADGSGGVGPGGTPAGDGTGAELEGTGSASGGATCEAQPTCSGDAIQCAQLMQQWRTRCPDGMTEAQLLDAINATAAEEGLEAGPNDANVEVSEIAGEGFIVAGACPNPGSFTVLGQTISMGGMWQPACDMAVMFAPIVQAMGFLFAALIIGRSGVT